MLSRIFNSGSRMMSYAKNSVVSAGTVAAAGAIGAGAGYLFNDNIMGGGAVGLGVGLGTSSLLGARGLTKAIKYGMRLPKPGNSVNLMARKYGRGAIRGASMMQSRQGRQYMTLAGGFLGGTFMAGDRRNMARGFNQNRGNRF